MSRRAVRRSGTPVSAAVALLGLAVTAPIHAQDRAVTVTGRVLDRSSERPVAAAVVELLDGARTLTDSAGAFRFTGVRPGANGVVVDAFGYAAYESALQLVRDTALLILLDAAPIQLDSVQAAARQVSVRGRVRDAATGRVVVDGDVTGPLARPQRLRINGSYHVRVPADVPASISVRAFGYLPARVVLTIERDTTVDVALQEDPVIQRMLATQRATLDRRVQDARFALRAIDRDVIATLPALHLADYLFHTLLVQPNRIRCFFIDEREFSQTYGFGALETYPMHTVQRIEIINRGAMIRVYTTRFAQLLLTNPGPLPRVEMNNVHCGMPRRW